jgi:prepilin-type N-terminal cleavage/methylation domain-containing protein
MRISKSGFTLIELLVVFAAISILSAIVMGFLQSSNEKGRNTQRLSDVAQLRTALNLVLNEGELPSTSGDVCVSTVCTGTFSAPNDATVDASLTAYIKKPTDPAGGARGGSGYRFNSFWPGGVAPYDGAVLPPQAYVSYFMELPVHPKICGQGRIYSVTSNYIQCLLEIQPK